MKIEYELRLDDVVALQKHLLRNSKKHTQLKFLTQLLVPFALAGIVAYKIMNQATLTQWQIFLFGGLALLWIVLHQLFFEKIVFAKVQKTVAAQAHALGLGKNSVEITDAGLNFQQNEEQLLLPWKRFVRLDETATHLFLVVGEFAGITVSKETAQTKDFSKFVAAFQKHLEA
ncbi:hypothetical protein CSB37_03680 [bacterium DOLZORAL124_38_8]|nr:MAG: hypothetical protein CSB37_03680 [bacterium DOLZORAL124_38_8]